MRNGLILGLIGLCAAWSTAPAAPAKAAPDAAQGDGYHVLQLSELPDAGNLDYRHNWQQQARRMAMRPYAAIDGPGRALVALGEDWSWWNMRLTDARVAVRAPRGEAVTGRVYVPNDTFTGMRAIEFHIKPDTLAARPDATYHEALEQHYRELWEGGFEGAAWFRHQAHSHRAARGVEAELHDRSRPRFGLLQRDALSETYEVYTGARAAGENLQLEAFLQVTEPEAPPKLEPLENLAGITIEAVDWKELIGNVQPREDPLAMRIPADQYAIFLPDVRTAHRLLGEMDQFLMPVLRGMEARPGDPDLAERYLRQLALPLHDLDAAASAAGLRALAVTGSDPYWPSGTDVAVLFEVDDPAPLMHLLRAAQSQAAEAAGVRPREAVMGEVTVTMAVTDDRRLSAYLAQLDDRTVVLSNSSVQMLRLHEVASGGRVAMGTLDEYTFMSDRHRYRGKTGAAVLLITDDAIRTWGGPRWRIAASRRIRMLAAMLDAQAQHLDQFVAGHARPMQIDARPAVHDAGRLHLTDGGVRSEVYNTPAFLTPIAELDVDAVTAAEARAYRQWRDRYQSRWEAFDPIGMTLLLEDERIEMELTVLPLIRSSQYRNMVELAGDAAIMPGDGDPHDSALVHFVMAIDVTAPRVREMRDMARMIGLDAEPFAWVGRTVAAYLDDDPLWEEVLAAEEGFEMLEEHMNRVPLGLEVAVRDRMRLAAFMVALRAFVQQTVPGLTVWENFAHEGTDYVRITADMDQLGAGMDELAIYYAAREALTLTLSEPLLHRAIERRARARAAAAKADARENAAGEPVWLGRHMALRMRGRAFELLSRFQRDDQLASAQRASWRNLPILNEWRHRYPDRDPLAVHAMFTQHRLTCPGGGEYVWNEQWQTMESSVYGHPGEPGEGPLLAEQLRRIRDANFGLTFEHDGLHGRAVLLRAP